MIYNMLGNCVLVASLTNLLPIFLRNFRQIEFTFAYANWRMASASVESYPLPLSPDLYSYLSPHLSPHVMSHLSPDLSPHGPPREGQVTALEK